MKILMSCLFDPTQIAGGGVENFVYELAGRLYKKHKVVTDVVCSSDHSFVKHVNFGRIIGLKVPNTEKLGRANLLIKKYFYNKKLKEYILNNGKEYDIIHINGDTGGFKELKDYNTITTFHGWTAAYYKNFDFLSKLLVNFFSVRYEIQNLKSSKEIIFVAKHVKKESGALKGNVIYNGINTKIFRPLFNPTTKLKSKTIKILWIGKDPIRKGLNTAIDAIKYVNSKFREKKVILLVVGVDKETAKKESNNRNIKFLGRVATHLKIRYLQKSHFFIAPSKHEGFSIAVMEALSCGLPVIISDKTGVNEIIKNGVNGFVIRKNDYKLYGEKIVELLTNKEKYNYISLNARKLALKYDWNYVVEQYYNFYKRILKINW